MTRQRQSRSTSYTDSQFKQDLKDLSNLLNEYKNANSGAMQGGATFGLRSFTVDTVDGKPYTGPHIRVELNTKYRSNGELRNLKEPQKPSTAARRIFKSLCKNDGHTSNCKKTFTMVETTQGSKKKIYGPYTGIAKPQSFKPYVIKPSDGKKATEIVPKIARTIRLDKTKSGGGNRTNGTNGTKIANFFSN